MLSKYKLWSLPLIIVQLVFDLYASYFATKQARVIPSAALLPVFVMLAAFVFSEVALIRTFVMDAGKVTTTMIETFKTSLLTKS